MLAVLPERDQKSINSHRARNLDLFVIESDDVTRTHSLRVSATEQLKPPRKRDLVFRVLGLERWEALHHALLEDHSGNCLNFARQFRADAETGNFRKLSHDLFDSFHGQVAR